MSWITAAFGEAIVMRLHPLRYWSNQEAVNGAMDQSLAQRFLFFPQAPVTAPRDVSDP
jgi:hypothetical protein